MIILHFICQGKSLCYIGVDDACLTFFVIFAAFY